MRRLAHFVVACVLCIDASGADLLPAETFARDFAYESAKLAPGGRYLAVTRISNGTTNLAIVDLAQGTAKALTAYRAPERVAWFHWKSENRLLYRSYTTDNSYDNVPGLAAIDVDGKNHVQFLTNPQADGRYLNEFVIDPLLDDPKAILLSSAAKDGAFPVPYYTEIDDLLPTLRGKKPEWRTTRRAVARPPGRGCDYVSDLRGVVRICVTSEEDNSRRVFYRANAESEWKQVAGNKFGEASIEPLGFAADNRHLFVRSNVGRNHRALYLFDPDTAKLADLLLEVPNADVGDGLFSADSRRLLGVGYYTTGPGFYYVDETVEAMHLAIIKAVPKLQTEFVSFSADGNLAVVRAQSAATPGSFYLYDRAKASLTKLLDVAPWIEAEQMGTVRSISFESRDGLKIGGYLTLPRVRPAQKLPLIVNAHGGQYGIRDLAQFDRESQFFASRGYAVLQINFRGSGGLGASHEVAGYGEWGKKMQDDLTDGVRWAVAQGIADPARVGIFGGSYGGYAAMMALVTSPEAFKVGLTYGGVSDVSRLVNQRIITTRTGVFRTIGEDELAFWDATLGTRDEAALRAISPLHNAAKIKAPVFIAHGAMDLTVPVADATDLRDALRRNGSTVDVYVAADEGHGFSRPESRLELYQRMEAFLVKHLPSP